MSSINRFILCFLVLYAFISTSTSSLIAQNVVNNHERLKAVGRVAFTEGPAWHPTEGVFFSDIQNNRIMRVDPSGELEVYRTPSGKANGLLFDQRGRLVACEGGNRRITRTESDGTIVVLADQFEGKAFNSPNDITMDSQGNLFFTDPRYGSRDGLEQFDEAGQAVEGVYRISVSGELTRVLGQEISRPNGIAVSKDDRFLFVAVNANDDQGSDRALYRFSLNAVGGVQVETKKKLYDWGMDRGPDGIALDLEGRVYATAGLNYAAPPHETANKHLAGVYVISPQGGLLDQISVPMDMVTNCAFGGADRRTLYITAGHTLWSVRVPSAGFTPWPR
ncbi:SMP-30/gluconolactonase/LRE family protein [bacterium]|nr:SMP-30/gluconolactonase/LRE family protein [bacterium]